MKKQAKDLKKGDTVIIGEQKAVIDELDMSDIGKQGKRKVRIGALTEKKEKIILVRPEDYPIDVL